MVRGYWIVRVDVSDPEAYGRYAKANGAAFAKFGGRFLVRGGGFESVAGTARARNVVLEFPSYEAALACWNSDLYQEARALQGGTEAEIIVIEGYDGPQPGATEVPPTANTPASE
ncbi:DUF1330 domain-containing protein [Methylobacterium gregans]|uniref:DUF1330 domain-containing protein n=1 Tax=Methylobacterium gregans TaxID=374424 RepID=A0AA37MCP4_9HYPH|nr:DUF1330 domain-containing protein [Methylobacterium gregans]MDQ0520397.1 uncharacterized protein (DUF1330 family) [Methylobacterium gregans]GJD81540.1 hypothetical protein NBEOAGPD_4793 [Methylobacterium gregans]GLS52345.1 hypothetical protein GCM10007886_05270 [Methylobacterium gregans]